MSHNDRKYEVYQIFPEICVVLIVPFLSRIFLFYIYYIHNLYTVNEKEIKVQKRKKKEKIFLDWLVFVLHSLSELRVQYINSCWDDSHYSKQYLTIF